MDRDRTVHSPDASSDGPDVSWKNSTIAVRLNCDRGAMEPRSWSVRRGIASTGSDGDIWRIKTTIDTRSWPDRVTARSWPNRGPIASRPDRGPIAARSHRGPIASRPDRGPIASQSLPDRGSFEAKIKANSPLNWEPRRRK